MATFIAKCKSVERTLNVSSQAKTLKMVEKEIAAQFGLHSGNYTLEYKDLEGDDMEISDHHDFEYFISLLIDQTLTLHVLPKSGVEPVFLTQENPFKKANKGGACPMEEVISERLKFPELEKPEQINEKNQNEQELTLLPEFPNTQKIDSESAINSFHECLSEAEILTHLRQKVVNIKDQMEQSLSEMKEELVRSKRKNSGVASREIESTYVHSKISCHNCGLTPINGKRYKCVSCKNYDLCEVCEENNFHSHHPMIRIVESVKSSVYYDDLASLIKIALGNLKTNDPVQKQRVLKSIFGEAISTDAINSLLNSRNKKSLEEIVSEFYKLLL